MEMIIRGGKIFDAVNKEPYVADILVRDGKIAEIGQNIACEGAEIVDAILMPGAHVGKNAKVQYAILAEDVVVEEGAVVGEKPEEMENLDEWGVAVVASGIRIGAGVKVPAKAMIEEDQKGGEQA